MSVNIFWASTKARKKHQTNINLRHQKSLAHLFLQLKENYWRCILSLVSLLSKIQPFVQVFLPKLYNYALENLTKKVKVIYCKLHLSKLREVFTLTQIKLKLL